MSIKMCTYKDRNSSSEKSDYIVYHPGLSSDRINQAHHQIKSIIPAFGLGEQVLLTDLELFLSKKYKAVKAGWKDINSCTKTKVKRFNKYCKTVFCVSESHVSDEEYHCAYIIKRENCVNPSANKDDFFYDLLVIVGSEDKLHLSSYYIGGFSNGLAEELYVLCGNK